MANSGVQVYYEVLPGVFVPVPSDMANLAPGTPLYMQVPSGTGQNPTPAPASSGAPPSAAYGNVPGSTGPVRYWPGRTGPSQGAPVYN